MSTISIPYIGTLKGINKAKTEVKEKTSSNHDCNVILGLIEYCIGSNDVGPNCDVILC
jgi:hypothetical protein